MSGVLRFDQLDSTRQSAIRSNLAKLEKAGASDDEIESYLRDDEKLTPSSAQPPVSGGLQDISPQLQKQADAQGVGAGSTFSGLQGIKRGFQSDVAGLPARAVALTQGIPGVRALAEGINSKMMGVPYEQVDKSVTQGLKSVPPAQRAALGMVGGLATAPFLPANPALAGGILGAASEAGNSAPTPLDQRLKNTIGGGVLGAGAGYAGSKVLNAIPRAAGAISANIRSRSAPNADQMVVGTNEVVNPALSTQRYGEAAAAAAPREVTPAVDDVLNDPDVQQVVGHLKSLPQYRNMAETDPAFLTAIDQHFTDTRRAIEKGLIPTDPAKPNAKRDLITAANTVQQKLRAAMAAPGEQAPMMFDVPAQTHSAEPIIQPEREPQTGPLQEKNLSEYTSREQPTTAQLQRNYMAGDQPGPGSRQGPGGFSFRMARDPGHIIPGIDVQTPAMRVQTAPGGKPISPMMPEYLGAVGQHAEGKGLEGAFQKGYEAQLANSGGAPLPYKQLATKSPAAIANEASGLSPEEVGRLQTGILSALKEQPGRRKMILPSLEAYRAAGLINASQGRPVRPEMSALLRNLLFGAASSPFTTP